MEAMEAMWLLEDIAIRLPYISQRKDRKSRLIYYTFDDRFHIPHFWLDTLFLKSKGKAGKGRTRLKFLSKMYIPKLRFIFGKVKKM